MARYPTPTEDLALRGSWRAKARTPAGTIRTGAPVMPKWLSPPAAAEWRRVAPALKAGGLLSPIDAGVLTSYVLAVAEVRECSERLAAEGLTVTCHGQTYPHPLVKVRAAAEQRVKGLAAELGLSPVSRKRAHVKMVDPDAPRDPMEQFFDPIEGFRLNTRPVP